MSTSEPIPVNTQAQLALSGEDLATYSLSRLGLSPELRDINISGNHDACKAAVARLFTIERADIDAHVTQNNIAVEDWYQREPGSRDGEYVAHEGSVWKYHIQERGSAYAWAEFDSADEFRKHLVNERLSPWLSHLRVPVRAVAGNIRGVCPEIAHEVPDGESRQVHSGTKTSRPALARIVRIALVLGALVWGAGFLYDVMFAGIPYQDPTEELAARYALHASVAGILYRVGWMTFVGGVVLWVGARVVRWAGRKKHHSLALLIAVLLTTPAILRAQSGGDDPPPVTPTPTNCVDGPKVAGEMAKSIAGYLLANTNTITADTVAQKRWLTHDLRTAIRRFQRACETAQNERPTEKVDFPDNATMLDAWDAPTKFELIGTRRCGATAMAEMVFYWGPGTNYQGSWRQHTYVFVQHSGGWLLDDIYYHGAQHAPATTLRGELRGKP